MIESLRPEPKPERPIEEQEINQLLEPVWSISGDKLSPIIEALMKGDRGRIEEGIRSLEEALKEVRNEIDPNSYNPVLSAKEAELRAKIAVLRALTETGDDRKHWEEALDAYRNLGQAISRIQAESEEILWGDTIKYTKALQRVERNQEIIKRILEKSFQDESRETQL